MRDNDRRMSGARAGRSQSRSPSRGRWFLAVLLIGLLGAIGYFVYPSGSGGQVTPGPQAPGGASGSPPAGPQPAPPKPAPAPPKVESKTPEGGATPPPPASPGPIVGGQKASGARETVEIGIAYGTEKRTWLEWAVKEFATTEEGKGIRVNLVPMGSLEGAHAILKGDKQLHVWSPASSLYRQSFVRDWEAKYKGNPILKEENLALTPMVFVMWKSRYDAFMLKAPDVSLKIIGYALQTKTGWGRIADKPEWGHFKFGHTHPNQSNSGLMTLLILAYEYQQETSGLTVKSIMSDGFQDYLARFERGVTGLSNSTGNMMQEMVARGPAGYDALMVYESVAIDFLKTAEGHWDQLQIAYPKYNLWNENPYYILNTPWTTAAHQKAAEALLKFLMSEPVQIRALDHGFRPGNPRVPVKDPQSPFVRYARYGLKIDLPGVCEVPSPEVIDNLLQSWIRNAVPR